MAIATNFSDFSWVDDGKTISKSMVKVHVASLALFQLPFCFW